MCATRSTHAVLVVEDELHLRMIIAETFEDAGFKVFQAGSASEAIEILNCESDIRAVFTDVEMPGTMDGIALAHVIRDRWPPTILIVSSASYDHSNKPFPSNASFLQKPYGPGILLEFAESLLSSLS
jgi:CheY-like chemotaxis protein